MKFQIFETRIGVYETYDEAFKKDVLEQALSFESTEGRFVSNMGGFQSIDVGVTGAFSSFVKEFVLPNFKEFLQEDFLNEDARLGLESMWVNINTLFRQMLFTPTLIAILRLYIIVRLLKKVVI